MITVFNDGKCNLCSKEIFYYKSIADNKFKWIDIAENPKVFEINQCFTSRSTNEIACYR